MIGVSFQPGMSNGGGGTTPQAGANRPSGVQEAIKVLSLRLPKVVGARAISPQALLESPGSGGNPRVDSVVNQVLARMFPTAGVGAGPEAGGGMAPMQTASFGTAPEPSGMGAGASFSAQPGNAQPMGNLRKEATSIDYGTPFRQKPNIIIDLPTLPFGGPTGDFTTGPGGMPFGGSLPGGDAGQPPASIGQLPQGWPYSYGGGGTDSDRPYEF